MTDRAQLFLDATMSPGGGGTKPDGTPTPRVDLAYVLAALNRYGGALVLDPEGETRWAIQTALRDAFGWDGTGDPEPHRIDRLRQLAATMTYLPPLLVRKAVLLDRLDDRPTHYGDGD